MAGERDRRIAEFARAAVGAAVAPFAWKVVLGLAVLAGVALLAIAGLLAVLGATASGACAGAPLSAGGAAGSLRGAVPAEARPVLARAAQSANLGPIGPAVLAGIADVESDFGRSIAPGVRSGVNFAGCCRGPFQFNDNTWPSYATDADGNGRADVYNFTDAAFAAAKKLRADGAPANWTEALLAYNNASWYVRQVLDLARRYEGQSSDATPVTASGEGGSGLTVVGASMFDDATGYRGDRLGDRIAFAELGYSTRTNETNSSTGLLGNLPYRTALRIIYRGRSVVAIKLDVGNGGAAVQGRARAIDLSSATASALRFSGVGLVEVERVDGRELGTGQGCAPSGADQITALPAGALGMPLRPGTFSVTSQFWEARSYERHPGVDLATPTGTPIYAIGDGRVVQAGPVGGYGNYTCIQHTVVLKSCYAHQSQIAVAVGQAVQRGQVIGRVGCTGNCTGPHLHFEIRVRGSVVCPAPYVGANVGQWCAAGAPGLRRTVSA